MRVKLEASVDHILAERRAAYLAAWPIAAQLEAHAEAAAGRPEKQQQMLLDLARIKQSMPIGGRD
jgi:hypothetical protein